MAVSAAAENTGPTINEISETKISAKRRSLLKTVVGLLRAPFDTHFFPSPLTVAVSGLFVWQAPQRRWRLAGFYAMTGRAVFWET